jgi:lipid II:glycine glycyltransferase (peptidoglycan interpeptide bridge formation enzyme)
MLHIEIASRLIPAMAVHHKWFADKPRPSDALRFAQYFHCESRGEIAGFRRTPKFTLLVDLTAPPETLLGSFSESTRYEINRSTREGVQLEAETDLRRYCEFLNAADTQGRGHVDPGDLAPYWGRMLATKVTTSGEPLAMHGHLFDAQSGRVLLYQSASLFAVEADSQRRNRIGRANRWLHYQEMLKFKELGASVYDLGGYAKGTTHAKLKGINQFKDGFGGSLAEQSNYISHVALLWNRLRGGTGAI